MSESAVTEQFERPGDGRPPTDPSSPRRRRWLKPVIWIVGILIVLVAAFFIADAVLRAYAQDRVAKQITSELPSNVTAKDLSVDIGGFSVIGQYLSGSLDEVSLEADTVKVDGVPLAASITAHGVPTDFSKPVGSIQGSVSIDQAAANNLITIPGATSKVVFGEGTLGYSGKADVFGLPLTYKAVVEPKANGKTVLLTPKTVKLTGGPAGLDLSGIVSQVLGDKPFPLCVAQYLPKGVNVTNIVMTKGDAVATVAAHDIVLDDKTLQSKGSCS